MAACSGAFASALGQAPAPNTPAPVPFERYVPASTNLFVRVRQLSEVNEALHRAHAWRLLPLLSGSHVDGAEPFDLRAVASTLLGPRSSIRIDDLMGAEMGLAAPSWSQLGRAVWFVRIPDEAVLDRWFPQSRRRPSDNTGAAHTFRTVDGVLVCVRNGVAAMARRAGDGSLVRDTVGLMRQRPGEALVETLDYRKLMGALPLRPLAVAYLAGGNRPATGAMPTSLLWPAIDHAAVGLYEGDGRIDFAVRASLLAPQQKGRLSKGALRCLMGLPETTLFAAAFTVDFKRALEQASAKPSSGTLGRYVTLLQAFRGPTDTNALPLTVGPQVVVAWGQDMSERGSTPQIAVMIESDNPRALRDVCTRMARNLLKLLAAIEPGDHVSIPTIQRSAHLGTNVMHVPLGSYAKSSRFPFVRLLGNLEPAWATTGNWLLVALTREHMERILEAQNGLIPGLRTVRDLRAISRQDNDQRVLALARVGLATDVLDRWLADFEEGKPSLLDPSWWRLPEGSQRPMSLGFGLELEGDPQSGSVVVARVHDGTPAQGRLQPGDRIIGVNGHLLDLEDSGSDLRRRLAASSAKDGPVLRALRGDAMLEVVLPRDRGDPQRPAGSRSHTTSSIPQAFQPAQAVRELASLGRTLQFAIFAVQASEENRYAAQLTLRFAPTGTPQTRPSAGGRVENLHPTRTSDQFPNRPPG